MQEYLKTICFWFGSTFLHQVYPKKYSSHRDIMEISGIFGHFRHEWVSNNLKNASWYGYTN